MKNNIVETAGRTDNHSTDQSRPARKNTRWGLIKNTTILATILWLTACASLPEPVEDIRNTSDPLIGKIVRAEQFKELNESELVSLIATKDVIYLGETHDNAHQHRIQLEIIQKLVGEGLKPTIGFEFFSREQTAYLASFVAAEPVHGQPVSLEQSAKRLRSSLAWGHNRDADWNRLYPILKFAREQGLPVFGADLPAGLRSRTANKGRAGLSAVEKLLVPASDMEDRSYQQLMYSIYTEAHCGWGNEDYMSKLYDTWQARNEAMAQAIVAAHSEQPDQPVVVILGGGHIQYGMGTVERVQNRQDSLDQFGIRLLEVASSPIDISEYFAAPDGDLKHFGSPYDTIWFTERMPERPDPCRVFNKRKSEIN